MVTIPRGTATTVYVGDLSGGASEKELERIFREFGRLRNVWIARNPPGFAFVEFEDPVDASDAVKELDGTVICGVRVRVEISSGKSRQKPWIRSDVRNGGPRRGTFNDRQRRRFDESDRCYQCGERGHYAYDCNRPQMGYGPNSRDRFNGRRRSRSPVGFNNFYNDRGRGYF